MRNRLYMDIHVLQILPASCVNRDDSGSPKEFKFGGTYRGRISSQAWSRAIRMYMAEDGEEIGIRTRKIKEFIVNNLVKDGIDDKTADKEVESALTKAGLKSDKKDSKSVMVYLSMAQINAMIDVIKKKIDEGNKYTEDQYKKDLKQAVAENPTSDMILKGRMMAGEPSLNYDAAAEIAHAFTVHEAREEYDYFTAVDDLAFDSTGAGHIDSKSFNSGLYYRYANVNLSPTSELIRMDKENAPGITTEFAESFIRSMPSGGCNSYANRTLPDSVTITLRSDSPISFASAFFNAVKGDDWLAEAEEKMSEYELEKNRIYGAPVLRMTFKDMSLQEMLDKLEKEIQERI